MNRIHYSYLRAVQEEGRYPVDAGAWAVTVMRLSFGQGLPRRNSQYEFIEVGDDGELPPLPPLPESEIRPEELISYRRLLSSSAVERFLSRHRMQGVSIGFPLSAGWVNPPKGAVEMPNPRELLYNHTHSVALVDADRDSRRFHFPNSWGDKWGKSGWGTLPYDFFDDYVFESFVWDYKSETPCEGRRRIVPLFKMDPVGQVYLKQILTRTETGHRHYIITIEGSPRSRIGWAFVTERDNYLDIEELYVRTAYRRRGLGTILIEAIDSMRRVKKRPIRVFIHWPESRRENVESYELMCKIVARLGCKFQPLRESKAAYVAIEGTSGAYFPDDPSPYPTRPRTPLFEIALAAALLVIQNQMETGPLVIQPEHYPEYSESDISTIKEALDAVNPERYRLIRKKNRSSLSPQELERYERLQENARLLADHIAPIDTNRIDQLKAILKVYGGDAS